jgi:dual specificity protein kinase YAK1
MPGVTTNPPPNTYYPPSRNRANTINQMDVIPPALARLTHFGMADPSGTRNLTPVLNRDEAIREWERRQGSGHSKQSSLANASYPQLEYLQEQAELSGGWGYGHGHSASGHYQMQPGIGVIGASPHSTSRSDYDPHLNPPRSAPIAQYLPAYPPAAATGGPGFDAFDSREVVNMGMLYTPLQPSQAGYGYGGGGSGGHQARASYSGPYQVGAGNNPFGMGGPGQGPSQGQAQGQGQVPGPGSPRWQRRSQGYGA